jgi:PAS domain S-box-containing protein
VKNEKSHLRLRELLECAPDAIFEIDREGRITLVNRMAEIQFGYQRGELVGQPIEILVPEAFRPQHEGHRTRFRERPVTRPMGSGIKLEAQRKDGSTFPVEISLSPVGEGEDFQVAAIVRDISERRKAEEELAAARELYIAGMESRNREVERANLLKNEYLANISHELRSPLHTIIGFSDLLEEESAGELNQQQKRFVGHVGKDARHLLALINDLLDLSKIEAGKLELFREVFRPEPVIDEALESILPRARAKSLELKAHVEIQETIYADKTRFTQILTNLLTNAVKFTPEGGSVGLDAGPSGRFAKIAVSDTGIGIPAELHDAVFDKFYQVRAAKQGAEGTGLGLAITRRLVEQHGGTIWIESEPGHGSRFSFTVPFGSVR